MNGWITDVFNKAFDLEFTAIKNSGPFHEILNPFWSFPSYLWCGFLCQSSTHGVSCIAMISSSVDWTGGDGALGPFNSQIALPEVCFSCLFHLKTSGPSHRGGLHILTLYTFHVVGSCIIQDQTACFTVGFTGEREIVWAESGSHTSSRTASCIIHGLLLVYLPVRLVIYLSSSRMLEITLRDTF